ncbi:MAG TPA: T9SS type A sorting domain-containing protein [Bacteroidia bacterium]|nr:T9SS type A sorting domain-containing protein [Bacteroidia bacterium]
MKKSYSIICSILIGVIISAASHCISAQSFTALESVPGTNKDFDNALIFELNGDIFVGAGFYSKRLYKYSISTDSWTTLNEIPGSTYSRNSAISFTINNKAYVLNGTDIHPTTFSSTRLNDFYEYDINTDTWTSKPLPPFGFRGVPAVFVLNNKAYIVGGRDASVATNTTWEFDGTNWTARSDFPLLNILGASSFVLNGKGYVVCGSTNNGGNITYNKTLYEYDQLSDTWTAKTNFPGQGRYYAFGFSADGKGYCGLGSSVNSSSQYVYYNDFYSYDPGTDSWTILATPFPASTRQSAVAISHNNAAYLGTGWTFIGGVNTYYRDWYRFGSATTSTKDLSQDIEPGIYPNPVYDKLQIEISTTDHDRSSFTILNILGEKIMQGPLKGGINATDISHLESGTYFLTVRTNDKMFTKRLIKN